MFPCLFLRESITRGISLFGFPGVLTKWKIPIWLWVKTLVPPSEIPFQNEPNKRGGDPKIEVFQVSHNKKPINWRVVRDTPLAIHGCGSPAFEFLKHAFLGLNDYDRF